MAAWFGRILQFQDVVANKRGEGYRLVHLQASSGSKRGDRGLHGRIEAYGRIAYAVPMFDSLVECLET